jgi:1,2-dihydroxy-3-keto-5-methylthiopentene dioxygenase
MTMSTLAIYRDNAELIEKTEDFETIANQLHGAGVLFERWQADRKLSDTAGQDEIIAAYRASVDRLMKHYNFKSADVISMTPDHPDRAALRNKFLDEHTHSDFEVRFFVEGRGLFFIHAAGRVYAILCTQGDLISVPANTPHWFDMGPAPRLKCIRLFTTPEGWVANYTGSAIAKQFPTLDAFVAR